LKPRTQAIRFTQPLRKWISGLDRDH